MSSRTYSSQQLENERRRDVDESNTRREEWARYDQARAEREARHSQLLQQLEQVSLDQAQLEQERRELSRSQAQLDNSLDDLDPVSYTHLTLPTIYSV